MGLEPVNFSSINKNHLIEWYGVIFLFRQIKRELDYLVGNIGMIGLSAFLCCFGGILLWVDGTNIWHVMRSGHLPVGSASVTGMFLLWLLTYGLCGTVLALILLQSRTVRGGIALIAFSVGCVIYLLQLVWYAVFFCTHLIFFAFFILLVVLLLTLALLVLVRHSFLVLKVLLLAITLVELYFIYFNLTFYLG